MWEKFQKRFPMIGIALFLFEVLERVFSVWDGIEKSIIKFSPFSGTILKLLNFAFAILPFLFVIGCIALSFYVPWKKSRIFYLVVSAVFFVAYAFISFVSLNASARDTRTIGTNLTLSLIHI